MFLPQSYFNNSGKTALFMYVLTNKLDYKKHIMSLWV